MGALECEGAHSPQIHDLKLIASQLTAESSAQAPAWGATSPPRWEPVACWRLHILSPARPYRPSGKAQPCGLEAPLRFLIAGVLDRVDEEALDLILIAGIVAEFRESADPQLENLVFDALLKVELQRQGSEGLLRGTKLLGDSGHGAQERGQHE